MPESTTQYATTAQLVQFSVPSAALTGISSDDQNAALKAASRVADSYLLKRFTLPLTQWGDDLRQVVTDIAAYRLLKRRGFNPDNGDDAHLRMAYEDAVKWLESVSRGSATPLDVVDSRADTANNTDAAGELSESTASPIVLQPRQETESEDGFWESDTYVTGGGVGSPRRRGW